MVYWHPEICLKIMDEKRNKLVIIGNGFDLAHGLKTSYTDFIKTITAELIKENSRFYHVLIENNKFLNWVDIESEYYRQLTKIYKDAIYYDYYNSDKSSLLELNRHFNFLKNRLETYLAQVDYSVVNQHINNLFQLSYSVGFDSETGNKKVHFLNFNYTNTLDKYIGKYLNHEVNYIHGQLNNPANPIIFGYGDETDEYYKKFEDLNINEFLAHFKSFGYFRTPNYRNLLSFINSERYDVEILGHSCGLSDRVMLSTIFEHDNCHTIKIHYYKWGAGMNENDFTSKTQEISRHFKDKAKMRDRIVDFTKCKPLTPFKQP